MHLHESGYYWWTTTIVKKKRGCVDKLISCVDFFFDKGNIEVWEDSTYRLYGNQWIMKKVTLYQKYAIMKESEEKRIYTVKSRDVESAYFIEEFAPEIY